MEEKKIKINFHLLLIVMVWIQTTLMGYLRAAILRLPVLGAYPDLVIGVLYGVVVLLALSQFSFTTRDICFYVGFSLLYCASFFLFKDTQEYWREQAVSFVTGVLPFYFVGVVLVNNERDREKTLDWMYYASIVTIFLSIVYRILSERNTAALLVGDMDAAYKILPHVCLVVYYAFKKPNVWNVLAGILGVLFLFFLGTRGAAFIGLAFACICFMIAPEKKERIYVRGAILAGLIILVLIPPVFTAIVKGMYQIAQKLGLSVRIFERLLEGGLVNSSGRDEYAGKILDEIRKTPFYMRGFYSDRMILEGSYVHNIVLELWLSFGVIFGSLLFIGVVGLPVLAWIKTKDKKLRALMFVLFVCCFAKLMLSGSYLHESLLFFLLGISSAILQKGKTNQIQTENEEEKESNEKDIVG